jgi:thymidylate kinase
MGGRRPRFSQYQERDTLNTKLIIVDGLPGSGKSSTSQFICDQLQRNGRKSRWYYEEEEPHPVAPTKGLRDFGSPEEYSQAALDRWKAFTSAAMESDEIAIIESRFFQDAIFPFLMNDLDRPLILDYIHGIAKVCQPLNPNLIYLFQPDYTATMRRICNQRGSGIEQAYIERNEKSTYGRRLGLQGFDGLVQFWVDLRSIMEQLFEELDIPKLAINNTERDWRSYYHQIGEFLSLPLHLGDSPSRQDYLARFEGIYTYRRDEEDIEFSICLEDGELMVHDYGWFWPTDRLVPKEENVFYLGSWPFEMIFTQDDSGKIVSATRVNPTGDWRVTGQEYPKIGEIPETARQTSSSSST